MKLSKEEINKIAKDYDLGLVRKFKLLKGGLDNFNYNFKTSKGKFILRILRENKNKVVEFSLLEELNKGFTYSVPKPIKSKRGSKSSEIKGKSFWIYGMLPGNAMKKKPSFKEMNELAKALALYHKRIKDFRKGKYLLPKYYDGIKKEFDKLDNLRVKTREDRFAVENRDLFEEIVRKFSRKAYSKYLIMNHSDFDTSNVLFEKGKITGILDFDYVELGPRIRDVAISIKDSCAPKGKLNEKWKNSFLEEYEKINFLTKEEKLNIDDFIMLESASFFIWAYGQMEKNQNKRLKYMKECVKLVKSL